MYTFTEASDIAIVGGGIAGVCLTLGLLKQNVNVTVYEGARSFHEIGGGISVGPNARRALQLLGPEVYEAVQGLFTNNLDPKEQDTFFSWRVGAPPPGSNCKDAQLVTKLKCLQGQSAVHRAHFLDELVKLLPKGVARFGKKLTQVEELDEKKGFRLVFRDGTEALHQHVIGCDGIKSVIRKHILGEESPAVHAHFAKKYVHRGVIPTEKAIAAVGEDLATNAQIYMGKNGYVNTLPINQGRSMNVGLFHSAPSWNHKEGVIPASAFERNINDDYAHFGPTVKRLIPLMEKTDVWSLFDTVDHPVPTFAKGRACIVGDAAHASTPSQGAGAGMAFEDAYVLSSLVGHALRLSIDLSAAFRAYDMVRRPRTQLLAETSREAGRVWCFERRGIKDDLEKIEEVVQTRFRWIWEGNLLEEVEIGVRFVEGVL